MSLKAKLEAVIYAAEEPVTLAQLTALFAADAFEWKAQREALTEEQAADAAFAVAVVEPLPLLNQAFNYRAPKPPEPVAEHEAEAGAEAGTEEPANEEDTAPAGDAADEAEARRLARLRDREARGIIRQLLDELVAAYAADERGIEIREIAGGYRMATKPEYHDAVRSFVKSLKPALKLSLPALETLAVIAYKQPVTAPEVNEIRGVDSSAVFGSLLARKLIATAGRKQVIGRPILYKTTREFLLRFGLKDVTELPSMEEFEKMAAIELEEPEIGGSGPAAPPAANPPLEASLEFDANAEEPTEDSDTGAAPESAPTPAATAVRPNPVTEPATSADSTPHEAAPAAPSPTEQAETETSPNGDQEDKEIHQG
jgi:segregation and condensation protein B